LFNNDEIGQAFAEYGKYIDENCAGSQKDDRLEGAKSAKKDSSIILYEK